MIINSTEVSKNVNLIEIVTKFVKKNYSIVGAIYVDYY